MNKMLIFIGLILILIVTISFATEVLVDVGMAASATGTNNQRAIVHASDGTIHVVYSDPNPDGFHRNSTDDGTTWSAQSIIQDPGPVNQCPYPSIDRKSNDHLLVVCEGFGTLNSTDGGANWVEFDPAAHGTFPDLHIDRNDDSGHVAELNGGNVEYWYMPPDSLFDPATIIDAGSLRADIAVSRDSRWVCIGYDVGAAGIPAHANINVRCCENTSVACNNQANWNASVNISQYGGWQHEGEYPSCAFDQNNVFHCVWDNATDIWYSWYNPFTNVSGTAINLTGEVITSGNLSTEASLSVYSDEEMYVVYQRVNSTIPPVFNIYAVNRTYGTWNEAYIVSELGAQDLVVPNAPYYFNYNWQKNDPLYEWVYTNVTNAEVWYDNETIGVYGYCDGNYTSTAGEWRIRTGDTVTCENETIWLADGENIEILGTLRFENITLRVNGSLDGASDINIYNGGIFNVTGDWAPSNLTNGDTATAEFRITVASGAIFDINNSHASEIDWDGVGGIDANGGIVFITNNTFTNCYTCIALVNTDNSVISENNFTASVRGTDDPGVSYMANNTISFNRLTSMTHVGIRFQAGVHNNFTIEYNYINSFFESGIALVMENSSISHNIIGNTTSGIASRAIIIQDFGGQLSRYNTIDNNTIDLHIGSSRGLTMLVSNSNITNNKVIGATAHGIYMAAGANNNIINNTINSTNDGLYMTASTTNNIDNNSITSGSDGIYMTNSDDNNLTNNTLYSNGAHGLSINGGSTNTDVINNTIHDNTADGINFGVTNSVAWIFNNTIYLNSDGIELDGNVGYIRIVNNTIYSQTDDGIDINTCDINYIENNTIDLNGGYGINMVSADLSFIVNNSMTSNTGSAIYLSGSGSNNVENNTINGTGQHSMYLHNADGNNISGNIMHNMTSYGIYFRTSDSNIFDMNSIKNGTFGIANTGDGNTITNNNITNTSVYGVYFAGADDGIFDDNSVYDHGSFGLYLGGSDDNNLTGNAIYNTSFGISVISGSDNNTFLENIIFNNTVGLNVSDSNISNHYFANSSILNSTDFEVALDTFSIVTLLNVTFNKTNTSVIDTSNLFVRWYVNIHTVDSTYAAYPNVVVTTSNGTGTAVDVDTTDASGILYRRTLVDFDQVATGVNWLHNDHNFSGVDGAVTGSNVSNVTTNDVGSVYIMMSGAAGGGNGGGGGGGAGGGGGSGYGGGGAYCDNHVIDYGETCYNCPQDFDDEYYVGYCDEWLTNQTDLNISTNGDEEVVSGNFDFFFAILLLAIAMSILVGYIMYREKGKKK